MLLTSRCEELGCEEILVWTDEPSGLRAILVIDDSTLGPAAGGIRTSVYQNDEEALLEVAALARSMTYKCALGGLPAGGAKAVVIANTLADRPAAFERLGKYIEGLEGRFRTAGDLGTTDEDLQAVAQSTQYVHTNTEVLAGAVARGLEMCIRACARIRGTRNPAGLSIAIQGCGTIGAALARRLSGAGAKVLLADLDGDLVGSLAQELGAHVVSPESILASEVDILAPCALGGVINEGTVADVRARAICGGANNIVASRGVAYELHKRGVIVVPDILSSGGAVIDGIGATVMGLDDRTPLIDSLGETAFEVFERSEHESLLPVEVAERLARERIEAAL